MLLITVAVSAKVNDLDNDIGGRSIVQPGVAQDALVAVSTTNQA